MSRESDEEKAKAFLQAQQHYYRELRSHKADLQRFQASREDHRAALALLADLQQKVGPLAVRGGGRRLQSPLCLDPSQNARWNLWSRRVRPRSLRVR